MRALVLFFLGLFGVLAPACAAQPRFDLKRDTFAFANETVLEYHIDPAGRLSAELRDTPPKYAHSCFVLTRAVLQFHQFARFAPELPKASDAEYKRLVRAVCRVPVWSRGPEERIVIPGFRDLHSFSLPYGRLLQENLGNWLPTYLRVGNYRMAMGHPRAGQAMAAKWLAESLEAGRIRGVFLSRFPHMNHALVAYAVQRGAGGDLVFSLYDPNYPGQPARMRYVAARRSFDFERRWYFPGGQVNVMRIYISPLH